MRKIILGVAVTLDGFIEGPNGEYDWCFTDQDYGMSEFLKRVDAAFYGRKSYEMMMSYGGEGGEGGSNPFAHIKSYVFTSSGRTYPGAETVSDLEEVRRLKAREGKDIWLFGGASLTTSLMQARLVDELWLSVHPILLGRGKPLFHDIPERIPLRLIDTRKYDSGLVSVRYAI